MGIEVTVDSAVATVTMANPGTRNALTRAMMAELARVLPELDDDPAVRVIVLTGADGDFCSGAALGEGRLDPMPLMERINRVPAALAGLRVPTIAKVDGAAVGAGMNLALGCDLVLASDRSRFSQIFVQRALSTDFGGSWLLPRLVGLHRAKELCLLGDILTAAQVHELGLLNRVVPVTELDAVTSELAARLVALPPLALTTSKRLLDGSGSIGLAEALRREADAQTLNLSGEDFAEALTAFAEKRPPNFSAAATATTRLTAPTDKD